MFRRHCSTHAIQKLSKAQRKFIEGRAAAMRESERVNGTSNGGEETGESPISPANVRRPCMAQHVLTRALFTVEVTRKQARRLSGRCLLTRQQQRQQQQ